MTQGRATTSGMGSTKVEPKPKAVNVGYVAQCGIHEVTHTTETMYEGRGYEAPGIESSTHHNGSQGRHR